MPSLLSYHLPEFRNEHQSAKVGQTTRDLYGTMLQGGDNHLVKATKKMIKGIALAGVAVYMKYYWVNPPQNYIYIRQQSSSIP